MSKLLTKYLDLIEPVYGVQNYECIIWHDGDIIYSYKSQKLDELKKDMYFGYSVSKPITCVGALKLVEDGKIHLDDKLSDYLPEFKKMYVRKDGEIKKVENEILIQDLFSMTAGFDYNVSSRSIKNEIEKNPNASTRDIVRAISYEPLNFEPGTKFSYSLCHDVLAAVVEEVSGMTFGEYQKKNIFLPLEMYDSAYGFPGIKDARMVPQMNYTYENGLSDMRLENMYFLTPDFESGGAGIVTTASDYMKFASTMANNGICENGYNLLKPETINEMKKNRLTPDMIDDGYRRKYISGYGYGLGVRTMIEPKMLCSSAPVGEFGWSGAAGAYTLFDTCNRLAIVYFQHVYSMVRIAEEVHPMIREIAYKMIKNN